MANLATLSTVESHAPRAWADATFSPGTVPTGVSTFTLGLPTLTTSLFDPNYPIGVMVLSGTSVHGSSNSGLPANVAVQSVTLSGSTITVTLVNHNGSGTAVSSLRWIFFQSYGEA